MIVKPRLNDYHGLPLRQEEVDFAIPFLDEDIPLYMDPFLLWKSPSQQDNALHGSITNSFNYLGGLFLKKNEEAVAILKEISECDEVGLGNSKSKKGKKIGDKMATAILSTFVDIPQIQENGFTHFELLQLLIEDFSKDRVSDISCNLLKPFLIDYTIQQSVKFSIPTENTIIRYFDNKKLRLVNETLHLPVNPYSKEPILLLPKRWLRFIPWINFEDFYSDYIAISDRISNGQIVPRVEILDFNRKNYDQLQTYIQRKELEQKNCKNDPLFTQIPIMSSKRKLNSIKKLPTGKIENADQEYEKHLCQLLASMLYPDLDFAQAQSRTVDGVLIRDLVFYNNTSHKLLKEIYENYKCKQIVVELKNTKEIATAHINQLNRYLNNEFGGFGIIFTRNKPAKNIFKNTIDLWAGRRKCILIMDDTDLELMCKVYDNKQRKPLDVITKKYVEFIRACPS